MKTSITKSKAGHYTVTLRDARGQLRFIRDKINDLHNARLIAATEKSRLSKPSCTQ